MILFISDLERYSIRTILICFTIVAGSISPLQAQIQINPQALDKLKAPENPLAPTDSLPKQKLPSSSSRRPIEAKKPAIFPSDSSQLLPNIKAPDVIVPPPPVSFLQPVIKTHSFPIPPMPRSAPRAGGKVSMDKNCLQLFFSPKSSDLTQEMIDATVRFAALNQQYTTDKIHIYDDDTTDYNDESEQRRLALTRGLEVRAILLNSGIPSEKIYIHVSDNAETTHKVCLPLHHPKIQILTLTPLNNSS